MLALVIIALAVGSLAVTFLSTFGTKARSDRVTEAALAKAKEALIAYAAADLNRPGELPCPDVDNDGQLGMGVDFGGGGACTAYIGRLPWAILQLGSGDLRDGSGERLWYAVSKNYRAGGTVPLNSDTPGQLSVTGITPASNVVAIVFAPGDALSAEDRTNKNSRVDYLEGVNAVSNADSTTTFTTEAASATFNDRLITIRPDEIFRLVEKRVGPELRPMLADYYTNWGRYPFAAPFSDPSTANYSGSAGVFEGLLPVSTTPATWDAADSTMAAGLLGPLPSLLLPTPPCSVSGTDLVCVYPIGVSALGISSTITVTAYVNNAGMQFLDRVPASNISIQLQNTLPPSSVTLTPSVGNVTHSLMANGRGVITIVATTTVPILVGSVTVTIPIPQPSSWLTTSWITKNKWQSVSYYSVAPGYSPNGANSCTPNADPCNLAAVHAATDCLSICDSRLPLNLKANNIRALLLTTGPALSTLLSHPSALLSHYLESGNLSVSDGTYEGGLITNTFNDQAAVLAPPPP